jgi:hypothetical protein
MHFLFVEHWRHEWHADNMKRKEISEWSKKPL